MMDFELYQDCLTEEENEEITAEVEADETRCFKNDIKSLARRRNQRRAASYKNEGFLAKKGKKSYRQCGTYIIVKPQTKAFIKTKENRAKRAEAKNDFKQKYVTGQFDEDIAGLYTA